MKKFLSILLVFMITISVGITAFAEKTKRGETETTILFTHDLHSHLLPSVDEDGEYGGYARLMTIIKEQKEKYPNSILVDGGDFSMGSLFQTAFSTSAVDLRMMGAMGYDVTTFGNHEFDYLPQGLASMLNTAVKSGDRIPQIVQANYLPPQKGEVGYNKKIQVAFENYGVDEYTVIERGGVYFVVFGIFGYDSDECAPDSGMIFEQPAEKAQEVVDKATNYCVENYGVEPIVVCLSHSGTQDGEGEDYELAKKVEGIDVIVSGHTHTTLEKPIKVNDTYIVSAGEYGKNLGVINLELSDDGSFELRDYQLIAVNENVSENKKIAKLVESFKKNVEKDYLSKYGLSFDEIIVNNNYKFDTVDEVYATQHESTLGNVFSDAYKWAVEKAGGKKVDVALTAAGVIRESLPLGKITVSDVFNAASLGVGTEGELIAVYITGMDLKNALEVDASVQPLMKSAQLFFSGVEYSFNKNRMIFNKVDYAKLKRDDSTLEDIEDDKLYCVVTGMYCGQMLGAVKSTSKGLISITPRDADGNPIDTQDLKNYVVYDENENPVKEWYAIASYLKNMNGTMDKYYSESDGRKVVYSSFNPVKLLVNANVFTYVVLCVIIILVLVTVLIFRAVIKRRKRKCKK